MTSVAFADVAHQFINFSDEIDHQKIVLELIDTRWVQRLREIAQTGNTSLVYMFSEHSRFGHSLGVAYLACTLLEKLSVNFPEEVKKYRTAVAVASLLHDVGHIAPGSHTAYKTWFPNKPDIHETVATRIIAEDPEISGILKRHGPELSKLVCSILSEDESIPPWTWEIISGGGWNVDRGNWCLVDSTLAGVTYGKYNVPAILEAIVISHEGHMAVRESRLDALTHFAVARHSMYRQVYQHRVLLAADTINKAIVQRVRDLGNTVFADDVMKKVIKAESPMELSLEEIYAMKESWWRYHLAQWNTASDSVLRDLTGRLLQRKLFKTVRVRESDNREKLRMIAEKAVRDAGYDSKYYLHEVTTVDMHAGDSKNFMLVQMDDGSVQPLNKVEPLIDAMLTESESTRRSWLVMPKEAKEKLGRAR